MAATTSENYVTETIFIPLYNRSAGFRKLISKAFPNKVDFGTSIHFTGNERNTSFTEKYGCPDAKSDLDNIIEIKINYSTGLTDNEKKGGCNGNGYEKYLKDNKDKYLLYVIPEGYNLEDCVKDKQRVGVITWKKILSYLNEQNEDDPYIRIINNKVEGTETKEIKTFGSYKAKVYETLIKCMEIDNKFHIHLNAEDDSVINNSPEDMGKDEFSQIAFDYDGLQDKFFFNIYFEKKQISFYLPEEYHAFALENGCIYRSEEDRLKFQLEILSQSDFWKWNTDRSAKEILKQLKIFLKVFNEMKNAHEVFSEIFLKTISNYAKENELDFEFKDSKKDKSKTMYFKRKGKVNWYYAIQFQKPVWQDLCYGIYYEGRKNRANYSRILQNSKDDSGNWVSYKDVDISFRNWGSEIFSKIQKSPENFINKYIQPLLNEIDIAIKKVEK